MFRMDLAWGMESPSYFLTMKKKKKKERKEEEEEEN